MEGGLGGGRDLESPPPSAWRPKYKPSSCFPSAAVQTAVDSASLSVERFAGVRGSWVSRLHDAGKCGVPIDDPSRVQWGSRTDTHYSPATSPVPLRRSTLQRRPPRLAEACGDKIIPNVDAHGRGLDGECGGVVGGDAQDYPGRPRAPNPGPACIPSGHLPPKLHLAYLTQTRGLSFRGPAAVAWPW